MALPVLVIKPLTNNARVSNFLAASEETLASSASRSISWMVLPPHP